MKRTLRSVLLVSVTGALMLGACTDVSRPATKPALPPAVTGTVTYLQRSALPPTAVVEVQLQDVSIADAPASVINTQAIETQGNQPPFPYKVPYDPARIEANHRYVMRATIKDGDKLLFTTTQSYPVITNGAPTSKVEIIVEPVP